MPQFNGKQERVSSLEFACLRCPRNGQTDGLAQNLQRFCANPAFIIQPLGVFEHAPGKAMEVVPSARIPANTVDARCL